jgi:branched-chain amino acid transport system ATP-binding protein
MTGSMTASTLPALELRSVDSGYGPVSVVRGADLFVDQGTVVALLGPNGAGKTTLLRTAAGILKPTSGSVVINGSEMTRARPTARAKNGMCLIPEGRGVFPNLTVHENLRLSAPPWVRRPQYDAVYAAFPVLKERRRQVAGTISGGQQQMLALSRATLAEPSVVLVDEASMGLAPIMVDIIFDALRTLASTGVALLLVEQYAARALALADRVYLMTKGSVRYAGQPKDIASTNLIDEYMHVENTDLTPQPPV